jgi:hypothetical protein
VRGTIYEEDYDKRGLSLVRGTIYEEDYDKRGLSLVRGTIYEEDYDKRGLSLLRGTIYDEDYCRYFFGLLINLFTEFVNYNVVNTDTSHLDRNKVCSGKKNCMYHSLSLTFEPVGSNVLSTENTCTTASFH